MNNPGWCGLPPCPGFAVRARNTTWNSQAASQSVVFQASNPRSVLRRYLPRAYSRHRFMYSMLSRASDSTPGV
jgi:hypothetical protein